MPGFNFGRGIFRDNFPNFGIDQVIEVALLKDDGDSIILESGDQIIIESGTP